MLIIRSLSKPYHPMILRSANYYGCAYLSMLLRSANHDGGYAKQDNKSIARFTLCKELSQRQPLPLSSRFEPAAYSQNVKENYSRPSSVSITYQRILLDTAWKIL